MTATNVIQTRPALVSSPAERVGVVANSPDYERARRAAGGDMGAFEEIYQLHHRRVFNLCVRMTMNRAEAEDLTQDIFIHLMRKLGSYRAEAGFTTWLHRLTVNQVLMHFRSKKAGREEQPEDEQQDAPRPVRKAATSAPLQLDRITLDRALALFPPGYRTAFVLHDIEGYEHEEIARLLRCSAGTSKSQLHKARAKLRHILRGQP